jgi:hypothetical protein
MAGLWADDRGFTIDPIFPFVSFSWRSRTFSIARTMTGIQGSITTEGDDVLQLRVRVASSKAVAVTVNERPVSFDLDGGFVRFGFPATRGNATRWSVIYEPKPMKRAAAGSLVDVRE